MADRTTLNISITPELTSFIAKKVASGRYTSASEVVREALRLLEEQEELREAQRARLRAELQVGLDQLARGEVVDGDSVFRATRKKIAKRRE